MKNIIFVTGNKAKVRETEEILGVKLKVADIDIEEIQHNDPKKIAEHKLEEAYKKLNKPVIIDDVSVEADVLNGFPGPFIKWVLVAGDGPSVLLKMLENQKNRKATAKLIIGYFDGKNKKLFTGEMRGKFTDKPKGENGFGWDKVFIPDGFTKTFAEMSRKEKNEVSHRKKALDKLHDFLKSTKKV